MHNFRRRLALSTAVIIGATMGLTACGDPTEEDTATPSAAASASPEPTEEQLRVLDDLSEIEVTGEFGQAPTVVMPEPFVVEETVSKVIIEGDGHAVPSLEAPVSVHYAGYNARTGEQFDSSWERGEPAEFLLNQLVPGFGKGIIDKPVGSRVVVAMTSDDGYGPSGNPAAGIEGGDSLVFIIDILAAQLDGPRGENVELPAGTPGVDSSGPAPKIKIGNANPPADTEVHPIIQGGGEPITAQDMVWTNAVCVTWDGEEFYNDYDDAAAVDAAQSGVHQALWASLADVEVGSRVLVTMPGDEAFPNGNRQPPIEPGTAAACVVDVLYKQSPPGQ